MKTSEIIKALRCTATVHPDDHPDCNSCPFFIKNPVPEEEIGLVPEEFYYFCDSDLICLEAADLLEQLSGKDTNVLTEERQHGRWLKNQGGFWEFSTCSCCQSKSPTAGVRPLYCPNCGAKMEGNVKNESTCGV